MTVQLSDHFTPGRLLRFTLPSILMMVFMSIYSVVDGYFVSNFAGKTALAAVNLVFPYTMMLAAPGLMLGTGGSALIAKTLGEGNHRLAEQQFSLFSYCAAGIGLMLTAVGYVSMPDICRLMGADGQLLEEAVLYGNILLISLPGMTLQFAFQSLFAAAGRPQTGLAVIVAAGIANIVLDALFVAAMHLGIAGAAWATTVSQLMGGLIPLGYFGRPNRSSLRLGRTVWMGRAVWQGSLNGLSELLSNISSSVVSMLYNTQLMRLAGENGVAAYSVLMYVNFVFVAIFVGFGVGVNPVVGYAYGAQNRPELRSLRRTSLLIVAVFAAGMTVLSEAAGPAIADVFVGYDPELMAMTYRGFAVYSLSFLFAGFPILGSAFFTGLNNGLISALISVIRTLGFEVTMILVLPQLLGLDGVWLSVVVAEVCATIVTFGLFAACRRRYGY
ncbi:MAG: MATE family efflux transporter [Clostridia bacterium]|nr:MATE family efflux transporter [Clostridia bacterium]